MHSNSNSNSQEEEQSGRPVLSSWVQSVGLSAVSVSTSQEEKAHLAPKKRGKGEPSADVVAAHVIEKVAKVAERRHVLGVGVERAAVELRCVSVEGLGNCRAIIFLLLSLLLLLL
jgi:hypothetical protein